MTLFKEINDLHDSLKAFAMNAFLIPFWYVAIFLFNNEFYSSSDNIIILAMTIVISSTSTGFMTFLMFKIQTDNGKTNKKTDGELDKLLNQMIVSVILLSAWLSLLIFIIYSLGFLFNIYIYFYYFLTIYYAPILIIYILKLFDNINIKNKDNKKDKQSNNTTNDK